MHYGWSVFSEVWWLNNNIERHALLYEIRDIMSETSHKEVMKLASEAGHILLENGAEIERVEDTMQRIASRYGVDEGSFFVLSNGIISTGKDYADAKYIPIHGASLEKVAAVNQVSRDIANGNLSLNDLRIQLAEIRTMPAKPWWEQVLASGIGAGFFAIIFGGSINDSAAAAVTGIILWLFMAFVASKHLSRLLGNLFGGLISALVCICCYKIGFGEHLGNMVIGAIIPLVPGVPFTNGMRDIANEDYIAGFTRLTDAFMLFLGIAAGVMLAFMIDGYIDTNIIMLRGAQVDALTYGLTYQLISAFVGTAAFAVLFGVPRRYYLHCGLAGLTGWLIYLATLRWAGFTPAFATFLGALAVLLTSRGLAVLKHCPTTVFLICGIFPLVPGGGLFWTSYYLVASHWQEAAFYGILSIKFTVAIALGILIGGMLPQHKRHKKEERRKSNTT